ncbi:MAG: amylo-alpha-1,6-glucosidase [Planctomycetota bacterium]|nr:amylo-alpha-1,6-glucosidase [Planctomycetota bacterium]
MTKQPDYKDEWLLTNGIGGYAMGTSGGINTRRYHGLLVAALDPPVKRVVCLHSTIDQFHPTGEDDVYVPLSTQMFGDSNELHPDGWRYQVDFDCDLQTATWTWVLDGGVTIRRKLALEQGSNACLMEWTVEGLTAEAMLTVRPMALLRNFHELQTWEAHDLHSTAEGKRCCIQRDGLGLILESNAGQWSATMDWWNNFEYPLESARGQDHHENVLCAGVLRVPLSPKSSTVRIHIALQESLQTATPLPELDTTDDPVADRLAKACRQFVVKRCHGEGGPISVIAGYPWFADWGRDSLISLPGLLLRHDRLNEAISLLKGFATRIQRGIIPNRFDDSIDHAYYNTADASLWFINAVHACFVTAKDPEAHPEFSSLIQTCQDIIANYRNGTDFGIRIDFDGLVMAGVPGEAVTWMDARINGLGVTARIGKPVELSALWYNALCCLAEMLNDPAESAEYKASAALTKKSFHRFWNEQASCCYDLLVPCNGNWRGDARIRPNQILATSLTFSPLTGQAAQQVLDCIQTHLLTPYGLRTLSPEDPNYRGRYDGDMASRDGAYHNGTVWPWLMGPYCDGLRAIASNGSSDELDAMIRELLTPLVESMDTGCIGQIAEIYDGDEPHEPHGCPAQAWSVAELARIWPATVKKSARSSMAGNDTATAVPAN